MQFKTLITATLAATVAAERVPYMLSKKSVNLVALAARSMPGYQPGHIICGAGNTCVEACGTGFEQCASTDGISHCYDQGSGETCCQDADGNACESGYYCAIDTSDETWCCPDGMSESDCAAKFSVPGGLTAQAPTYTATPYYPTATDASSTYNSDTTYATDTTYASGTAYATGTYRDGNGTVTVTSATPTATSGDSTVDDDAPIATGAAAGSLVTSGAFAALFALAVPFL